MVLAQKKKRILNGSNFNAGILKLEMQLLFR